MVEIRLERTISAPPDQVFAWLVDPANLAAAPLVIRAGWEKTSSPPGVGATRIAIATGMWFREEITAYDPPTSYSYLIRRSFPPFNHDGGTLTCTPTPAGTHVTWTTTYTHPKRAGGATLEAVSSRMLPWNFGKILDRCAAELEH